MHKTIQLSIGDLNPHLLCVLCSGYLVDATTIIECLHSFCRSCIVRYLETSKYCPICDVQIHKTKPLLNIRSDKTLQDIVYKLVPGLFKDEMKRRRAFYADHPDQAKRLKNREELGRVDECHRIYTEKEKLSVCLHHCVRLPPYHNGSSFSGQSHKDTKAKGEEMRYLLCPAAMTVGLVKKFIRLKFELDPKYKVEVFHSDESLKDDYTLMDVAHIYAWRMTEPLKLYYIVFDCTKFVLDHGSTESDSSLLTDPGGGVTSIRRRKKIKGRRYKLGSNEDSDSPSECGATPSYVLRPVEMVREKRQRTESVEEQTLATEPNSADCQNLQDSVDINIKKESTYLSNMNDVTKVGEKTEGVAPETKTAASGGECTVDGKPDDTTSLSKDDNTEKSAEDFVMQVEEDADEEDIPLAVLKKKLTEQKVGAKELKQESCDVKDEGSHDQLEISCDNEDNANADSSDSDTTSYEVHSGVEENNVFSDVEDNEITTFNATSTKVIDTSTGDSNCSGGVENEQNSDIIHGDPKEALDKTEGKTLLSLTSDEKSTDTAKASALRSCTKEMAVTNRTSFGANSIVSPTMSTAPSSMEIATSTSQNPVIYVSACTTSVESVSKNAEKTATSSQLVTQVSKSMAMTFAVPGRTTDDKNTASTLASDSTVSTCTSSSSSSLSITSSQTVNNNYKLLEMKTSSASLPDSVSVSVSNCSNSQSSPTTTSAIPVDIKPVYLYHNPVSIADQVQTSCVLSSQVGGVLNCTNGMGPVSDHQPVYSQISHSYPTADGQLKKEVLDIKQNIVGCHRTASASKVNNKQTPSLATELLTQFGADVLQQINPLQKVETIVEGIKRKRGRPPKDKSKLLAQIKAQQSPAKLPRLLPKGINGNAGPFYHPGNPGHNNGHQANLQTSQLCPVSANMNSIQPYGCIAPLNGLSVFSANPMVNLSQLQNNTRMMASGATNTPYLQTVGNALYHHHHQPSQGPQQLVRPINGHFQNPMLSPTRPGLGGQQLDPMAAESKKQVLLGNHSNQCLDQPILPITIAPKMEKVEQ